MLVGPNLAAIPFISSTDSTRLQMSSKQLAQAVTSPNCEVPKVIGSDWEYLLNSSIYRKIAIGNGEVIYKDDQIMIIMYKIDGKDYVEVLEIPFVKNTYSYFGTSLRNIIKDNEFYEGDVLYEYDCYNKGLLTFGYNLFTTYLPWFGFNHEDAVVISESTAEKMTSIKFETVIIPVYSSSYFEFIFPDSKYGFVPEVGMTVDKTGVIASSIIVSSDRSQAIRYIKMYEDRVEEFKDKIKFMKELYETKLFGGKVVGVRAYRVGKGEIVSKKLNDAVMKIYDDYKSVIDRKNEILISEVGERFAKKIMREYYLNPKTIIEKDMQYIIHVDVLREDPIQIGDKITTRYANKGVVSLILPDDLMPEAVRTGVKSDVIIGPISIFSRMIIGQILENIVSKVIVRIEKDMKKNSNDRTAIKSKIMDLAEIAKIMNSIEYSEKIKNLANEVESNPITFDRFIDSIDSLGLYFECPSFANFDVSKLLDFIDDRYPDCHVMEPVRIPKKTLDYMICNKLGMKEYNITGDIVLDNVFCSYTYIMRLKHDALSKITARDFGGYSKNGSPLQGHDRFGQSSKLGHMEISNLLGAGLDRVVDEIYMLKSDVDIVQKSKMISDIMKDGRYSLPPNHKNKSYSKLIIESLMDFILNM